MRRGRGDSSGVPIPRATHSLRSSTRSPARPRGAGVGGVRRVAPHEGRPPVTMSSSSRSPGRDGRRSFAGAARELHLERASGGGLGLGRARRELGERPEYATVRQLAPPARLRRRRRRRLESPARCRERRPDRSRRGRCPRVVAGLRRRACARRERQHAGDEQRRERGAPHAGHSARSATHALWPRCPSSVAASRETSPVTAVGRTTKHVSRS